MVQSTAWTKDFYFLQNMQTVRIWVSPASYSMCTFPGVKQVECEADDTPPYSTKVNEWSYTSTPPISVHGKERINFIFSVGLRN
jgi:hypothetical protein